MVGVNPAFSQQRVARNIRERHVKQSTIVQLTQLVMFHEDPESPIPVGIEGHVRPPGEVILQDPCGGSVRSGPVFFESSG